MNTASTARWLQRLRGDTLVGALAALLLAGCVPQSAVTTAPTASTQKAAPAAEDLTLALGSLRQLAEGTDAQPAHRTIFYLNQWISANPAGSESWQPDRLLDSVPRALRGTPGLERLGERRFRLDDLDYLRQVAWLDDISYLQQNLWLHDIASRVRRENPPKRLASWLKMIESSVGLPEAEQLATAERLLDWTTRNIQLDPLPPVPRGPLATASSGDQQLVPAQQGELGPGYKHLPLQVLLYGNGDAHERARIFILLCRQASIDAVMLGILDESSPTPRGWIPAALVAGKLYLFDTGLGLPIPGKNGVGIATLDEVAAEPKLLEQLHVEGMPEYPVAVDDLKRVVAMIDAEPAALSQRMRLLQEAMPSASRLALAVEPRRLEPMLRQVKTLSGVSLWRVPFDAVLFRLGESNAAQRDPARGRELHRLSTVFNPGRPLLKARNLHLQGRFENEDQKPAARSLYMLCRPSDRELDALKTNASYRAAIGFDKALPENPSEKDAIIDFLTTVGRDGKFNATFWLGLTYYEVGNYAVAIEWLGKRTVQVSPPSPWTPGARYNLARCYEQLGQLDLARQWLESDTDSPQRRGNLLRAKMLRQ